MKIGCKIESMVGVNFKKLLVKIVNLLFKYILSSYLLSVVGDALIENKPFSQKSQIWVTNQHLCDVCFFYLMLNITFF